MTIKDDILHQVEAILDSDSGTDSRKLVKLAMVMIKKLSDDVTNIKERIERIETLLKVDEEARKGLVDWVWVRDKLMQPVVTALILWILLTFLPNVLRGTP